MSAWKEWMLAIKSGNKEWEDEAYAAMRSEAEKERLMDAEYEAQQYAHEFYTDDDMEGEEE